MTAARRRIGTRARMAARHLVRAQAAASQAQSEEGRALATLVDMVDDLEERFCMSLPKDPYLLDLLSVIDVEQTGPDPKRWRWWWRGQTTHTGGTPMLVLPRGEGGRNEKAGEGRDERSVARYLAIRLGVITEDERRTLQGDDKLDVNPYTRRLVGPVSHPRRKAGR